MLMKPIICCNWVESMGQWAERMLHCCHIIDMFNINMLSTLRGTGHWASKKEFYNSVILT